MENVFDKIEMHLSRKKAKPDYDTDKKPVKPKVRIEYFTEGKEYDEKYATMHVEYNYYSMTITYRPYKVNPYSVYIETQATFGRIRQELGVKYWNEDWASQEDVIEYIRYKLR